MESSTLSGANGGIDSLNCFSIESSTPLNNLVSSKFLTLGDGARAEKEQKFFAQREARKGQREESSTQRPATKNNQRAAFDCSQATNSKDEP